MFIDSIMQICDRIMRQTAERNPPSPDPKNLSTEPQEAINKPPNKEVVRES